MSTDANYYRYRYFTNHQNEKPPSIKPPNVKSVQQETIDMISKIKKILNEDEDKKYSKALSILEFEKNKLKLFFNLSNDDIINFEYDRIKEIVEKGGKIRPLYSDIEIFNVATKYKKK
jgi:hypothetical protein